MTEYKAENDFEVYAASVRREMLPYVPESAAVILDVGCSVGNFGELLKKERGAEVWGVETDETAAALAGRKLDKVICGEFKRELGLPEKKFDCIVFNDVLEHMIDPYGAIRYAKELLNERGRIVASIPNVRYFGNVWQMLVKKDWEYVDTGILDRTHLRFFTKKSIAALFTNLGCRIETLEGINAVDYCDPRFRNPFRLLNLFTLGQIEDMRWLQFAVVARPEEF
jgi:2-polyprenyl-3-methyl-5-hydroxy-6-metoxy-1,4-benzoquinol methylase